MSPEPKEVFIFQIPKTLKLALEERARRNDRSAAAELRTIIRESVSAQPAGAAER